MGDIQDQKARDALGMKLKKAREENQLTQAELAKKAHINVNYYARVERGEENPTFEKLNRIAKALSVNLSDLVPS